MKPNAQTMISIASIVIALITLVLSMNRTSEESAQTIKAQIAAHDRSITILERDADAAAKIRAGRQRFMAETAQRLDFLCDRAADCVRRYKPMELPE